MRRTALLTATALISCLLPALSHAQGPPAGDEAAAPGNSADGSGTGATARPAAARVHHGGTAAASKDSPETVVVMRRRLLSKQRNVTSAAFELDQKQVQAPGPSGSIQSVLKQLPSVNSYQSGFGQSFAELSIRGVRQGELASDLDGIPFNDLISGGTGSFLTNNVGAPITLAETGNINVYPGVAAPDVQGIDALGGTIDYHTKRPTDTAYLDLTGGVGSFGYDTYGFEANSGSIKSMDGLKMLLQYNQSETSGFIENTNGRFRDMLFSVDKPYDNGLSDLSATVIYNNDFSYVQSETVPTSLLANNLFYNFPKNEEYTRESNNYLTVILGDQTYISKNLVAAIKAFYISQDTEFDSFANPDILGPNEPYIPNFQNSYTIYGPIGPSSGTIFTQPGRFTYDPLTFGSAAAGQAYENNSTHTDEIGIAPKINIFLPHNNISIGGIIAKEWYSANVYVYGAPNMPEINGYNSFCWDNGGTDNFCAGSTRTVYTGYVQDRVDLLDNKLHIEPALRFEGIDTVVSHNWNYGGAPGYQLQNFYRRALPYLGVSYDLPGHVVGYASTGRSTLYPPATDYAISGGAGGIANATYAPKPVTVHSYQAGLRYDTPDLYVNVDYYYQKETAALGFYTNFVDNVSEYGNYGTEEFKGFEANVDWRVSPKVTLFFTGSYNISKYLESYAAFTSQFEDQFGYAFKGDPLANAPKWLATTGVDYTPKNVVTTGDSVDLRFWMQYTGAQNTLYNLPPNEPNPILDVATVTSRTYELGAFATFNLDAKYRLPIRHSFVKNLLFDLNIQNIFDKHYYTYLYGQFDDTAGAFHSPFYYTAYPGMPLAASFQVTARF
ncbi:TonB-dependent receptor [Lichenicola sp.]|uniref:TonB-dependent receptor n=1 Tax=Lichenicola sp. TaxID=2804529 RepID=UPI003B00F301